MRLYRILTNVLKLFERKIEITIKKFQKFAKTILVTISLYILQKSNISCFGNRKFKKKLLNKLSLKVTISKIIKTNINILQIAILNRFRIYYKNTQITKVANNIYKSILYCFRIYFIFSILTKIVLNYNLKLIEEKFRSNK